MKRRALLVAAASVVPSVALAQRTFRGLEVPAENDWEGEHRARPPVGDAAERAARLFEAIQRDDPEHARDFFFPLEPFRVLKGIADPEGYWNVLWGHYERDIHALHATVPAEATFERFEMTRRGAWVDRREEANAIPYWASRHDWVHYRVGESARRFEVRTLINWGPRWYVTHLG
ncbi:MAG: hypothetical protein H6719_22720 [Sandaracinaceae bacterium]|nr:hypothetical protein [Sandaracinaceae bacterium]